MKIPCDFSNYETGRGGRPRCWYRGRPLVRGDAAVGVKDGVVAGPMAAIIVSKDAKAMLDSVCADSIGYDSLVDTKTGESIGWYLLCPLHRMPSYSPASTGVLAEGQAPVGVRGGSTIYYDTTYESFYPAYDKDDIKFLNEMNIHLSATRECYGEWSRNLDEVHVPPQPRLVVSKMMSNVLRKMNSKELEFVPIRVVDRSW